VPQFVVSAYWPEIAAETDCEPVPLFETVTVCALLVVPVACEPKDNDVGVTVTLFSAW
jgi:hypothetical protein